MSNFSLKIDQQSNQSEDNLTNFASKMIETNSAGQSSQSSSNPKPLDENAPSTSNISIVTTGSHHHQRMVHFAESFENCDQDCSFNDDGSVKPEVVDSKKFPFYRTQSVDNQASSHVRQKSSCHESPSDQYSTIYLCPQDSSMLLMSRSSPASPSGSNISIIGTLVTSSSNRNISNTSNNNSNNQNNSSGSWKLRTRYYSKRKGQERSIDRERQPSICSDSETDSICGQHKIEDLLGNSGNTKKWSLPLPVVIRSSESDSASSSWSARSADEATEDERSPVPSPSASTHSNDDYLTALTATTETPSDQQTTKISERKSSIKALELETKKMTINAVKEEQNELSSLISNHRQHPAYKKQQSFPCTTTITAPPSTPTTSTGNMDYSTGGGRNKKDKGKGRRKKKMSKAAESHNFQRMKTTNYGRCIICDAYVYFWGFECTQCQLICHKKCLKKMAIMCPRSPLPPRSSILSLDLESLPTTEMVPLLVQKCTMEIERRSIITRPGIYRMTGVASRVEKLLKSFESGAHLIDLSDVSANDLTSVLKVFLRELKTPVITNNVYKDFIDIGRIYRTEMSLMDDGLCTGGHSQLIQKLQESIAKLPIHHRETLKHMLEHLEKVAMCHEQNNMSPAALGIIFAPTFFRPRDTINDLYTEVFEAAPQARVIELLIRFNRQVFQEPTSAFIQQPISASGLMLTISNCQNVEHQNNANTESKHRQLEPGDDPSTDGDVDAGPSSSNRTSLGETDETFSFLMKNANTSKTTHTGDDHFRTSIGSTSTMVNNNNSSSSATASTSTAPSSANLTSTSVSLSPPLTPPTSSVDHHHQHYYHHLSNNSNRSPTTIYNRQQQRQTTNNNNQHQQNFSPTTFTFD